MTVRKSSTNVRKKSTKWYDPPSGWQYGFPKPYTPLPAENLRDTLRRDGYPEKLMELAEGYTRFWETEEEE
jgi:hypothetical protein